MLPLTRSRNRARFFGAPFSPEALFAGGTVAGAWYDPSDLTTLFTTSAGTTQCAMPGQGSAVSVGLMLDKSQNGVGTNGAKRVNLLTYSEEFGNAAWTRYSVVVDANATTDPLGGNTADRLKSNSTTNSLLLQQAILNLASGASYIRSVYAKADAISTLTMQIGGTTEGNIFVQANLLNGTATSGGVVEDAGNGWWRISRTFTMSGTTNDFYFVLPTGTPIGDGVFIWGADLRLASEANTQPTYQRITDTWYSTIAGNHAIAFNNTTARPELRARVNLLTYSEQFDNAAWTKTATSIAANTTATADPLGGNTADKLEETAVNSPHYINIASISSVANTVYSLSIYAKAAERTFIQFLFVSGEISGNPRANFDLSTGQLGSVDSGLSATITSAGNGWYRCSVTFTAAATTLTPIFGIVTSSTAARASSYLGVAGSGIYIWGADLRHANIGANVPAYQRIADANTYDTSGFPLYLRFDGIDDSMYTPANLNLSGTDKATVFAGVRKLSDAAVGMLTELSANWNLNAGTFLSVAPDTTGASGDYVGGSRGSAASSTFQFARSAITLAPVTNVFTATHDIPGDLSSIRLNGAANGTNGTADKGTGNFGTYPLYIGARNNSSLYFNGHLHSLIIAGSAVSAGNISATEQWVANKTGIVIP